MGSAAIGASEAGTPHLPYCGILCVCDIVSADERPMQRREWPGDIKVGNR